MPWERTGMALMAVGLIVGIEWFGLSPLAAFLNLIFVTVYIYSDAILQEVRQENASCPISVQVSARGEDGLWRIVHLERDITKPTARTGIDQYKVEVLPLRKTKP